MEIPRHEAPAGADSLVDKFHEKNRYIIASRDQQVCGMVAVHSRPPFSVSELLEDVQALERLCPQVLEARILAVAPGQRHSRVFAGLACAVFEFMAAGAYRYLAISGLAGRKRMYERMGFRPLGPATIRGKVEFVPMLADLENLPVATQRDIGIVRRRLLIRL
jgi:hypothetical protein